MLCLNRNAVGGKRMEIKLSTADFSSPVSGSGPRTLSVPVIFPTAVQRAAVGITGYTVEYGNNDDHHVGRIDVEVGCSINDNVVLVDAVLGLRDWSGDWDDPYMGKIDFAVVAELAPVPPRPDLIVSDVEMNQAVQFFRSDTYLSAASALPDNAISLASGKHTALRVYPDWDASLGLPLSSITGTVTVNGGGSPVTLNPLNPAPIAPRTADTINMAVIEHTLNFMIPGALCNGELEITVQLWDPANPASKSALFTRTLVFTPLPELGLFVVGVNYTAQGLNLPAPTQAQFTSAGFAYLQDTYPMGSIVQTGYSTITFNENVNFTIGSGGGCGTGMNDLLTQMDDLRGSSNDVYLAVLPPLTQIQTPGSNIGGCGHPGSGAVFVDQTLDVPHEVGHALGRNHAPCDPGQCNPPPANVDGNYPSYGTFPAGSIGVFGFDPVAYQVLNPASTFDTMAYRFPQWISAYTYLALAGAGHPTEGGTGGGLGGAHALTGVPVDTLFLSVQVNRDRSVRRRVSFHYPARPAAYKPCSCFTVELLDVDREVLVCAPLSCDCNEVGHHCWPKHLRSALPYPKGSRWLLIYEDERKIHEEWIPEAPEVVIGHVVRDGDHVELTWQGKQRGDDDDDGTQCCQLWYLAQWYDTEDECWRGVAPRTRDTSVRIPPSLLLRQDALRVRVLASCGVATGMAQTRIDGYDKQPGPNLQLVSRSAADGSIGPLVRAVLVDPMGRHLSIRDASWMVGSRQVAQGAALDLRTLPRRGAEVRLYLHTDGGAYSQRWTVQREGDRFRLQPLGQQQAHPPCRLPS
jgi:hypothetical protein